MQNSIDKLQKKKLIFEKIINQEIDVALIIGFIKLNSRKLSMALILGAILGFGIWKYFNVYTLQMDFGGATVNERINPSIDLNKLSKTLSSIASKNSESISNNKNLSALSKQEWWAKNLKLNYEQTDINGKKVNVLTGFTVIFRDFDSVNASQKISLAEKFIKEGGSLLGLESLLHSSLMSNQNGELKKIEVLTKINELEKKIQVLEELQKKGYEASRNPYIFIASNTPENEKYLPYSVQLNAAVLDLYQQKQDLISIENGNSNIRLKDLKAELEHVVVGEKNILDSIKRVLDKLNAEFIQSKKINSNGLDNLYKLAYGLKVIENQYTQMKFTYSINNGGYVQLLKLIVCSAMLAVFLQVIGILAYFQIAKSYNKRSL